MVSYLKLWYSSPHSFFVITTCWALHVQIRCGIFQEDTNFSPLLFVLSLMPLTLILQKCASGYKLGSGHHHVNHSLYLKLYGRNQQEIQSLVRTVQHFIDDISRQFGFEKCASLSIKRGKVQFHLGRNLAFTRRKFLQTSRYILEQCVCY